MNTLEHPGEDCLLDLVNGLLPEARRGETVSHLRSCGECAGTLRTIAGTHERAHHAGAEAMLRMPETLRRLGAERAPLAIRPASVRRLPSRRMLLAAAGLIAVLGAAAILWTAYRPARVTSAIAWLPSPEATVVVRDSSVTPLDPRVAQGLAAYRLRDADRARRLLAAARAEGALEQVRRLYLGNAELQLHDPRAALETLGGVDLAQVPEPWRGEAHWSLALALAQSGRTAAADSIWRLLSEREDEVGARARAALETTVPAR